MNFRYRCARCRHGYRQRKSCWWQQGALKHVLFRCTFFLLSAFDTKKSLGFCSTCKQSTLFEGSLAVDTRQTISIALYGNTLSLKIGNLSPKYRKWWSMEVMYHCSRKRLVENHPYRLCVGWHEISDIRFMQNEWHSTGLQFKSYLIIQLDNL